MEWRGLLELWDLSTAKEGLYPCSAFDVDFPLALPVTALPSRVYSRRARMFPRGMASVRLQGRCAIASIGLIGPPW